LTKGRFTHIACRYLAAPKKMKLRLRTIPASPGGSLRPTLTLVLMIKLQSSCFQTGDKETKGYELNATKHSLELNIP